MGLAQNSIDVSGSRVHTFVDFWNFELSVKEVEPDFLIDWFVLGQSLAEEATSVVDPGSTVARHELSVYGSYDPGNRNDQKLYRWASNTLGSRPGVNVKMLRRRRRDAPYCPSCHQSVLICPQCGGDMRGTQEKGVDGAIITDLISQGCFAGYDVAVLVSSDRDFVPAVEFLAAQQIKVIHGAFPPKAAELTRACWGSINLPRVRERFRRS